MSSHKASSAQPSSNFSSGGVSSISSGGTLSIGGGIDPGNVQTFWDHLFDEEEDENQDVDPRERDWRDCIIFLIDCSPPMFEENESGEIPFQNAVKCVIATLTDKIISSHNDVIGVCFYGTEKKKNLNDFENIYVFFELDSPDAMKILDLEALSEGDFELGSTTNEFPFSDALWTCSTMFSNCPIKIAHKRIFLFTNEDNPNSANTNLREQSFQRAKDLAELGIDIELFSMNKVSERFNFRLFYQNIISVAEDEDTNNGNMDAASKFEELKARVRRKEFKKRNSAKLPFYIIKDVALSVKVFSLVHETKKGGYVWLDSKNNQPVKLTTQRVCVDTGTLLMDSQIKKYYLHGGERVIFDKDEVNDMKSFDTPGIRLIGFRDRASLKFHHNIKHASFIYPDEDSVKGSTTLFAALYERMLASNKMAIAAMTARTKTPPRLVALLAQKEVQDEDGSQLTPPGLHVIQLPFADDLRDLKLATPPDVSKEQIAKAKKFVKTLRIKFDSRNFENPALQKHYADLQAVALERTSREETVDYVQPDVEGMLRFNEIIEDFKGSVYPDGYEWVDKTPSKSDKGLKRKMGALADLDWDDICESGAVNKLTVVQLKEFLKCQGVKTPAKAKKENFVQAVVDHVTSGKLKKDLLPKADMDDDESNQGGGKTRDEDEEDGGRAKKKLRVQKDDEDEDEEMANEQKYVSGKGKAPEKSKPTPYVPKNKAPTATTNTTADPVVPKKGIIEVSKSKNTKNDDNDNNNNNKNNNKNSNKNNNNNNNKNNKNIPSQGSASSASAPSFVDDDDDEDSYPKHNKNQSSSQSLSQSQSQSQSKNTSVSQSMNSASSGSLSFNNYTKNKNKRPIDDSEEEEESSGTQNQKGKSKKPEMQRTSSDASVPLDDSRPKCQFWERCYRTNPDHLKQFRHPPKTVGSFSQ